MQKWDFDSILSDIALISDGISTARDSRLAPSCADIAERRMQKWELRGCALEISKVLASWFENLHRAKNFRSVGPKSLKSNMD